MLVAVHVGLLNVGADPLHVTEVKAPPPARHCIVQDENEQVLPVQAIPALHETIAVVVGAAVFSKAETNIGTDAAPT